MAIPAIVFPILAVTNTDPGLKGQSIEIVFYNKESTNIEVLGKVQINIDHIKFNVLKGDKDSIDVLEKHKYCTVPSTTNNSSSSSGAKDCTEFKQVTKDNPESVLLAKLAHQYITVQHFSNILKTKENSNTSTSASSAPAPCTVCNCTNCNTGTATGTLCAAGTCCCTSSCTTDITTPDDEDSFTAALHNLSSSYNALYFVPTNSYIFLDNLKLSDITAKTNAGAKTTEVEKVMYGSLLYSFVDYYYNTTDVTDEWVKTHIKSTSTSSSTPTTSSSDPKYFINYPMKFKYTMQTTSANTKTNTACTSAPCDLNTIYTKWNTPDTKKTTLENADQEMKHITNCNKIGQIEKSKLANVKDIFKNICSCTNP